MRAGIFICTTRNLENDTGTMKPELMKNTVRNVHAHANPQKGDELSRQLFMSDKVRPLWDLEYLMSLGFCKSICGAEYHR